MDWNEIYAGFRRFADRAAEKINRTADIASLQMKLSMAQKKLDDAFLALGKVSYVHFTSDKDESQRVASAVATIEHIKMEIHALEAQIAEAKRKAEEAKAEAAREQATEDAADADAAAEESDAADDPSDAAPSDGVSAHSDADDAVEITVETDTEA